MLDHLLSTAADALRCMQGQAQAFGEERLGISPLVASREVDCLAPLHGPVVSSSMAELLRMYRCRPWLLPHQTGPPAQRCTARTLHAQQLCSTPGSTAPVVPPSGCGGAAASFLAVRARSDAAGSGSQTSAAQAPSAQPRSCTHVSALSVCCASWNHLAACLTDQLRMRCIVSSGGPELTPVLPSARRH